MAINIHSMKTLVRNGTDINRWIDSRFLYALLTYFMLVLIAEFGLYWTYSRNHEYWIMIWGERGPRVETCLLLLSSLVVFWLRIVLFPAKYMAETTTASENRFEVATRSRLYFRIGLAIPLIAFCAYEIYTYLSSGYRWLTPLPYFLMCYGPVTLYFAWCFEVVVAVISSYNKKRLEKVGVGQLSDLAKQLQQSTQDLVWSMGSIAFFFLAYFGSFYLNVTYLIAAFIIITIIAVSTKPWFTASSKASKLLQHKIDETEQSIAELEARRHDLDYGHSAYGKLEKEIEGRKKYLQHEKELLSKFNFYAWLAERRKDLIPVTAINLLPILSQIVPQWYSPLVEKFLTILK